MSTRQIFVRALAYGLVLSAVDAIGGRMFRVKPDPSVVLSLAATAWIAYRLAEGGQSRLAFLAGVALFGVYMLGFLLWASLLVGWNGAVPWQPRSTGWLVGLLAAAPIVAVAGQLAGVRAARARAQAPSGS